MARRCALEVSGALLLVGINSPPQEQRADLGHASCLGIPNFRKSSLKLRIYSNTSASSTELSRRR